MIHGKFFCMLDVGEWAFPPSDCATGLYLAVLAISLLRFDWWWSGRGRVGAVRDPHVGGRGRVRQSVTPAARRSQGVAVHLFSPPVVAAGGQHSP